MCYSNPSKSIIPMDILSVPLPLCLARRPRVSWKAPANKCIIIIIISIIMIIIISIITTTIIAVYTPAQPFIVSLLTQISLSKYS